MRMVAKLWLTFAIIVTHSVLFIVDQKNCIVQHLGLMVNKLQLIIVCQRKLENVGIIVQFNVILIMIKYVLGEKIMLLVVSILVIVIPKILSVLFIVVQKICIVLALGIMPLENNLVLIIACL